MYDKKGRGSEAEGQEKGKVFDTIELWEVKMGKGSWIWEGNGFDTEEHLIERSQTRGPWKHHRLATFTNGYTISADLFVCGIFGLQCVFCNHWKYGSFSLSSILWWCYSSNNCSLTCCLKQLMHFLLQKNQRGPPTGAFKFGLISSSVETLVAEVSEAWMGKWRGQTREGKGFDVAEVWERENDG